MCSKYRRKRFGNTTDFVSWNMSFWFLFILYFQWICSYSLKCRKTFAFSCSAFWNPRFVSCLLQNPVSHLRCFRCRWRGDLNLAFLHPKPLSWPTCWQCLVMFCSFAYVPVRGKEATIKTDAYRSLYSYNILSQTFYFWTIEFLNPKGLLVSWFSAGIII